MLKLQIVVFNTNLMRKERDDEETQRQWEWLEAVLQKFQYNSKTVSLFLSETFYKHESTCQDFIKRYENARLYYISPRYRTGKNCLNNKNYI